MLIRHLAPPPIAQSANNVQSLLALLRSAQGDGPAASAPAPAAATSTPPRPTPRAAPGTAGEAAAETERPQSLSELLAQLGPDLPGATASPRASTSASAAVTPPRRQASAAQTHEPAHSSAFDGPRHGLIDPFGPVGVTPGRRDSGGRRESTDVPVPAVASPSERKGKRKADDMGDRDEWAFTRCLPVLTDLLRDDEFVREVRKMKSDQDAMERRLWARMEKVKAEAAKSTAAEREVARLTRRPVSAQKLSEWDRSLKSELNKLFRSHVLPSVDGLASRQRSRLVELGVPGLGSGEEKGAEAEARNKRVKRILAVLEGVVE